MRGAAIRSTYLTNLHWIATAAAFAGVLVTAPARADRLDEIRRRGELIWGADQEGGGPYVYPDETDTDRVTGFEVDLADALAAELGVQAKFFQADWNTLP